MAKTKEIDFEEAIEQSLLRQGGYAEIASEAYDAERAIFSKTFLDFIKATQPKEWAYLEKLKQDGADEELLKALCRALDSEHEGCLSVLRHGFKCMGKTFYAAYFAPASGMNEQTKANYAANVLGVTRQVYYSTKHKNSLDMVLSLNGIPVATLELKNPMTGQNWRHAVKQYKNDRDPNDLIFEFKKRSLVHFALDPDEVRMTTRLNRGKTFFLPFNLGDAGGAGNPLNPEGYRTAYLWEQVLERESFLDVLARFMHLEVIKKTIGKTVRKIETMIFPRYHQLDCVRKMVADAYEKGSGVNYLVQHSAGSGKSNSIGWLAHRLSTLHAENDEKVFDSVVVVTDRVVLDQQLQNTIYQFEHRQGVVQKIDENSQQLADALAGGTPIIITTLQKFPFAADKMINVGKRRYAVIIDEAHSSQGGETAKEMKAVLGSAVIEEEVAKMIASGEYQEEESELLLAMLSRAQLPNISFFAFTATPKAKTLEVFGTKGADGKPRAFHLYSMRQAIEEEFIHDVLSSYTTYKAYWGLIKKIEDDPDVDKKKAAKALARYTSLHPTNIAQKAEVMIEHFRQHTRHKIGGKAKAMVVTSSRLHAVRYKLAFDEYIKKKQYQNIKTLVAFSGTVTDHDLGGIEYTEAGMNKFSEKELPERFGSDEFQVLLVAEKYQTGFDQPLLHTMFVDKRLAGIQAVQTLSRLNRTAKSAGKEDTFVLDFYNEREEIKEAFQPYYEATEVSESADIDQLYELQAKLNGYQVYYKAEVEEFSRVFFKPKAKQTAKDHADMNACIDPACKRFLELDEPEQEAFRKELAAFRSLYSFLSQVIPFQDTDLERLFTYIRMLITKLPKGDRGPMYNFGDEVALKYYRLQKISEGSIVLEKGVKEPISGPTALGTGAAKGEEVELSTLIEQLNERFGTEFTKADQLFFDSIVEDAVQDERLQEAADANTMENFGFVFGKTLEQLFIERMDQNESVTAKFMNEDKFRKNVSFWMLKTVYDAIKRRKRG